MKKQIICLLCAAILLISLSPAFSSGAASTDSISGSYWKAVEFGGEADIDEFWSDLFLWEDGSGYFRFSQASAESNYYGMREVFDCKWVLDNGALVLTDTRSLSAATYTGAFEQSHLVIIYDGNYFDDTFRIVMERAEMPLFGAQWEIPELYGVWRMLSYSDSNGVFTVEGPGESISSEIAIHTTGLVMYRMEDRAGYVEVENELGIGIEYDEDVPLGPKAGAIWEGSKNRAWHVELRGNSDPAQRFYVTYAGDKLLFKKTDDNAPYSFPKSFTAEYELTDIDVYSYF